MEQKLEDLIFLKFGVEKDDYNHAINIHKLKEDMKVQEKLRQIEEMVTDEFQERMKLIYQEEEQDNSQDQIFANEGYTNDDTSE